MTYDPFKDARQTAERKQGRYSLGLARVADAPDNSDHVVIISPVSDSGIESSGPVPAEVAVENIGEVAIPSEGDLVVFGKFGNERAIVLQSVYSGDDSVREYQSGDRIIGNENGYIAIREDGSIDSSGSFGGSYSDEDAVDAINADADHGSTASHDYFSGSHDDLTDVSSDDHHTRYSDEEAQDAVAAALVGSGNVSVTYDDATDTITVDTSALNEEEVEDAVSTLLSGGTGISLSYDDANDTLTIDGFSGSHTDLTDVSSDDHHSRYTDEEAQDAAASMVSGGDGVDTNYDDANDTLTVSSTWPSPTPSFSAHLTADSSSSEDPMQFDDVITNVGGHYDSSTYKFTAPVDGVYKFEYGGIEANSADTARMKLKVNGTAYGSADPVGQARAGAGSEYDGVSASVILSLSAGDEVWAYSLGDTGWFDQYTFFNGHYVGPS